MIGPGKRTQRALLLAAPGLTLLASLALADHLWLADLIANLAPQTAALCVPCALLAARRRLYIPALLSALAASLTLALLLAPRATHTQPHTPSDRATLSLLHANVLASNPRIDEAERLLLSGNHDILTLMELPRDIGRALRAGAAPNPYPHMLTSAPMKGLAGWVTILSRWPLERWDPDSPDDRTGTMCAIAHTPHGPLGIVAIHAPSPWSPTRWRIGNIVARRAASIAHRMRQTGIPVIVVGDLNATPLGARSRRLARDAGLRRAKPLASPRGTYPAFLPWPLSVAIDDALLSDNILLHAWRTLECPGSDHAAVEIQLLITPNP